jgi:hypothetical protein
MPFDRLAIPMSHNPARQKLWRAVGFFGIVLVAILLGYLIDRAIYYRSSPQRWPEGANVELRLIKTPRINRLVDQGFAGVQALPGAPWELSEALSWSDREFVIYADKDGVVGLVIDGDLPEDVLASLANWGWASMNVGRRTLIVPQNASEPGPTERHINLWLSLPIFDGTVMLKTADNDIQGLPFRFSSPTSLDFPVNMTEFIPKASLTLPSEATLIGSFALSPSFSEAFLPGSIPASFPGLQDLSEQAKAGSIDLLLGTDEAGMAFVLGMPNTRLSLEELGAIATEGISLQTLSTTALTTEGLSTSSEIRSLADISVNVSNNDGIDIATAGGPDQELFRLTQSSSQLIVSNREPIIGLTSATYSQSCLKGAQGFIRPNDLSLQVPGLNQTTNGGIFDQVVRADEIAFRKNWLRICW